jgi:hypothetical protein
MVDLARKEVSICGARGEKDPCQDPCAYITNVPIPDFDICTQSQLFQFMCNMKYAQKEGWRSMWEMQSSSPEGTSDFFSNSLWPADILQCDEQRPGCVRCVTSNIQCPGYFQETKFLYQGAGLRRKFHYVENGDILAQKRQNAEPIYEGPPGLAVVLDKSGNGSCRLTRCITQDKTGVGSERTINETSEREPQSTNVPSFVNGPHVAEVEEPAPSEVSIPTIRASVEDYDNVPDLPETPHPTFESSGTESFQLNDESLSENLQAVFPSTSKPSSQVTQPREASETEVDDALEVLFLIRHFSETVGPW